MVERKECERLGLRVEKRKNGENHDSRVIQPSIACQTVLLTRSLLFEACAELCWAHLGNV